MVLIWVFVMGLKLLRDLGGLGTKGPPQPLFLPAFRGIGADIRPPADSVSSPHAPAAVLPRHPQQFLLGAFAPAGHAGALWHMPVGGGRGSGQDLLLPDVFRAGRRHRLAVLEQRVEGGLRHVGLAALLLVLKGLLHGGVQIADGRRFA